MEKRNIICVISSCLLLGVFAVGTHSQTRSPNQTRDRESILKDAQQRREQRKEERARELAEFNSPARKQAWEEKLKERRKRADEMRRELLREKAVLKPSEEQWERIKAKLLEIRRLRRQALVAVSLNSGGGDTSPGSGSLRGWRSWQWDKNWAKRAPSELIEGEKLVDKIVRRIDAAAVNKSELTEIMDALRKTRKEAQDQLLRVQQELRKELTVRQQAILMLMEWL